MEKKNYLIISMEGLASDIAYELINEGHEVKLYIQNPKQKSVMENYCEHVEDWEGEKDWADIIIFDDVGFGTRVDELRKEGHSVIGGGAFADKLEMDRDEGIKFVKANMPLVKVSEIHEFDDFKTAIEFIRENKKRWVIKFEGLAGNMKDLLYCGKFEDGSDVIDLMEFYQKIWKDDWGKANFILQEFKEGTEVGVSAYFNGKTFIRPFYYNFEYKRLRDGDIGVMTGQEGEHQIWTANKTKLFDMTLKPMEKFLRAEGYVGSIDVNGILTDDGYYFLEFTMRFGYNSVSIEIEVLRQNGIALSEFFVKLLEGQTSFDIKSCHAIGVLVTVPTYPFEDGYETYGKNLPIIFRNQDIVDRWHPHDVKLEDEQWVTSGTIGYVCSVCEVGASFEKVRGSLYENLRNNLVIPKMSYRQDIGHNWLDKDRDRMMEEGYL